MMEEERKAMDQDFTEATFKEPPLEPAEEAVYAEQMEPSVAPIYTSAEFDQAATYRPNGVAPTRPTLDRAAEAVSVNTEPVNESRVHHGMTPQSTSGQHHEQKKQGFFARNKAAIATGVICSLMGGIIGGGVASSVWSQDAQAQQQYTAQQYSQIPSNSNTVQTLSTNYVSPVVDIAKAVTPAVVGITNKATMRNLYGQVSEAEVGTGSGVIFRNDGYIITNYHVVEGATALSVNLADGRTVDGIIVGTDETTDLAVIKIEADNLTAAVLGDSDALEVGELAVAIGNPLGNEFARTVTDGIISGTDRTIKAEDRTYQVIQTNAAINSGNSGGPLVNSKGEVIGINSVKIQANGVEGMGFAIPINEVKPIVNEIMENGYVSRPYMGITGMTLTDQVKQYYRLNTTTDQGVLIYSVVAGSPAQQSGLQAGDVVYKVDDTLLQSMDQLTELLADHKAGDTLLLLVDRNGTQVTLTLTLGDQGKVEQQQIQQQSNRNSGSYILPW